MKIKQTFVSFNGLIDIGKHSFFIEYDYNGIDMSVDKMVEQAKHFNSIVIFGDEPFNQMTDTIKFLSKMNVENPESKIIIHTNGMIKPVGFGSLNNTKFYVTPKLMDSGISYESRIDRKSFLWFKESDSVFIYHIVGKDNIDEVNDITKDNTIKRSKVYLIPGHPELLEYTMKLARLNGYNISIMARDWLWTRDGEH